MAKLALESVGYSGVEEAAALLNEWGVVCSEATSSQPMAGGSSSNEQELSAEVAAETQTHDGRSGEPVGDDGYDGDGDDDEDEGAGSLPSTPRPP